MESGMGAKALLPVLVCTTRINEFSENLVPLHVAAGARGITSCSDACFGVRLAASCQIQMSFTDRRARFRVIFNPF